MLVLYLWPLILLFNVSYCQTTDKYTDEDRPYKFGFNIQGYQHRQEEKDNRGLIKGEYGFITADGYYRVTVYATDENGDFKILSMKNYYVGFPPEDPTTTPAILTQRFDAVKNQISNPTLNNPLAKEKAPRVRPKIEPLGLMACSNCRVPVLTKQQNIDTDKGKFGVSNFGNGGIEETNISKFGPNQIGINLNRAPGSSGFLNTPNQASNKQNFQKFNELFQLELNNSKSVASKLPNDVINPSGLFNNQQNQNQRNYANNRVSSNSQKFQSKNLKELRNDILDGDPKTGVDIDKTKNGLPPGITVEDIKNLFYKFNYTTGFHGHLEYGYRNGDKEGDYFFDGRDGTERQVKYQANEFGYQPNITFLELLENDDRRPREETEKNYGLKGYEFKWFYRR